MAAKKLTAQQQRDRRSKIMLGVLGAVFLIVLVVEVPSMLGGKKSSAPPATTTPAGAAAPVAPPSGSLASAQVVATPQTGQLRSFSRFAAKDPFNPLVKTTSGAGASASTTTSAAPPASGTPTKTSTAATVTFSQPATTTTAVPTGPMVLGAVMKLNGARRVIAVGSSFPAANPVFKLVAVGRNAIWISLIGGSFGNGQQTLKVQRGHPLKLVNTTASLSYLLRLVRLTMLPKPAAPPASAAPTTSASTTTTGTAPATTTTGPGG